MNCSCWETLPSLDNSCLFPRPLLVANTNKRFICLCVCCSELTFLHLHIKFAYFGTPTSVPKLKPAFITLSKCRWPWLDELTRPADFFQGTSKRKINICRPRWSCCNPKVVAMELGVWAWICLTWFRLVISRNKWNPYDQIETSKLNFEFFVI